MRPLLIRSGRNSFEICILIGLVAVGIYGVATEPPSATIDQGLSHGQRVFWAAQGLIGATVALAGLYWRPMLHGLYIERWGMFVLFCSTSTYVYVLCTISTFARSGLVTTIACAIALAAAWRWWEIGRDVRDWRAVNRGEAAL